MINYTTYNIYHIDLSDSHQNKKMTLKVYIHLHYIVLAFGSNSFQEDKQAKLK